MTGVAHVELRTGAYADSVTLLQVSRTVAALPGVIAAQVVMATPLNVEVLASMDFRIPAAVSPNDMVVALRLEDESVRQEALAAVDSALAASRSGGDSAERVAAAPRTTRSALSRSGAELALVSVPGQHAFVEAMDALDAGRDVLVFSDNVPLEQELVLKRTATERGLLVMGPDCGTALVGGVGLGFANTTRPGPVGMVAASGTGCQQLLCLLDAAGVGVGAALGVGGRDLGEQVGGLSTMAALRRLDADPAVELIVVVSKPPAPRVADAVRRFADELTTPVLLALLAPGEPDLTGAAEAVLAALGRPAPRWPRWGGRSAPAGGRYLRGLFAGGTLCDEAMLIAAETLGPIRSNIPLDPALALDGVSIPEDHSMLDFGEDSLTKARAHPMIDPTLRLDHLAKVAADPDTAVVLVDVVLGHGAEPDPAATLAPAIAAARQQRQVPIVVTCVGTESDPQGLHSQAGALAEAGAEVFLSNADATRRAVELVTGGIR
ncbi:succinyl-CoA synthetase subunit alpha [Saccharomonospora xinjiangensis]|uniref:Succinyl-CoA synthetase, alpha subunit n=1 Tax=Saccharomonospora xinjiangensis XJ-54 TaxID=882086 RepID=I0V789_9PSEU|nr:succinyl-CoA synthetase subunit alpha [Saccharomonospora xinjiangensis]EID55992.1 succinyl-CoA synthetase, alpha subunit [Saccharomonospora xinjiangensis XJ-54]